MEVSRVNQGYPEGTSEASDDLPQEVANLKDDVKYLGKSLDRFRTNVIRWMPVLSVAHVLMIYVML